MRTNLAPLLAAAVATAGCQGSLDEVHLSEEALSPVTEIGGEITSGWLLEELAGLYRDRERLSAEDGEAYAAGWGMSLDEANEHADDLIEFHVRALFFRLADEEGDLRSRASLAEVIADYADVETEEVVGDLDGVDVPFAEAAAETNDDGRR